MAYRKLHVALVRPPPKLRLVVSQPRPAIEAPPPKPKSDTLPRLVLVVACGLAILWLNGCDEPRAAELPAPRVERWVTIDCAGGCFKDSNVSGRRQRLRCQVEER